MTAIDSKMLAKPFVIESSRKGRPGDDDPTTLVVRDDLKPPKGDATARGVGAVAVSGQGSGLNKTPQPERTSDRQVKSGAQKPQRDEQIGATTIKDTKPRFGASIAERDPSSKWIWIVIGIVLLAAAAVTTLYFTGYIQ